jgi:DNA-binding GntR family transcriptional regulator
MHTLISREIYQLLKNKIIDFELLPGQILMVQQLAAEHDISRTPVREALVRLKEEGFVEETQGRKFKVSEVTWAQITDLYQIRKILEAQALIEIAGRITGKQVSALEALTKSMEKDYKNGDHSSFFENDLKFHNFIFELYGNKMIIEWMRRMQDHQQRIRYLTATMDSRLKESIAEHTSIVKHLREGGGEMAAKVLSAHLDAAVSDIMHVRSGQLPISRTMIK